MKKQLLILMALLVLTSTAQAQWSLSTNGYSTPYNIGIGISNPGYKLHVEGPIGGKYGLTPSYTSWYAYGAGDGGAAIYNDNGDFKKLMVVGNTSAGGSREVGIWDKLTVFGNSIVNGNVGIGTSTPKALLDLGNSSSNRKISLYQEVDNDHQFYGFGISNNTLRFQIPALGRAFRFYSGINASTSAEVFTIQGDGNVGVGTSTPSGKLEVNGRMVIANAGTVGPMGTGSLLSFSSGISDVTAIQENFGLNLNGSATAPIKVANTSLLVGYTSNGTNYGQGNVLIEGRVGIGTTTPDAAYKLSVNGSIRAKEVKVNTGWSDYVFYNNYKLKPLGEVESYIQANKHLPEVPSAAEVEKNGINLGETDALLLKKIEELTLYLIEQNKKLDIIQQENKKLQEMNKVLSSKMDQLEKSASDK